MHVLFSRSQETGVTYVQFPTGAAVLVDKDGKPVTCKP
ncbi:hypothetical protein SAMN05444166_3385 [Singulisphaera sp. GP187]|nr:hypothetical protein SAMN05444166_3385 [Singulisphaera sp. GP187]